MISTGDWGLKPTKAYCRYVASGPLVRSSYHAKDLYQALEL